MADAAQAPNHTAEDIHDTTIAVEAVYEKLRECYDPEIPVNIVDLGLIYALTIPGDAVNITMTLTAIAGPVGPDVMAELEGRVLVVDGVASCDLPLTFH